MQDLLKVILPQEIRQSGGQNDAGMPSAREACLHDMVLTETAYSAGTAFQTPFPTILPISIFEMTVFFFTLNTR